jgi:hypothetical protein
MEVKTGFLDISFNNTMTKKSCDTEKIFLIKSYPYFQIPYILKSSETHLKIPIAVGQYRISVERISKEKNIDIKISYNDTFIDGNLSYGNFIYFEVTDEYNIIPGKKHVFEPEFMNFRRNKIKQHVVYWNTYWLFLHTMAYNYPSNPTKENKDDIMKLVVKMMKGGLACRICTSHFIVYSNDNPIKNHYNNKEDLFRYFFDLHNDVNERNKKTILSYDDVKELYTDSHKTILEEYNIDILHLIKTHNIHTISDQMNSSVRKIIRKNLGLI